MLFDKWVCISDINNDLNMPVCIIKNQQMIVKHETLLL